MVRIDSATDDWVSSSPDLALPSLSSFEGGDVYTWDTQQRGGFTSPFESLGIRRQPGSGWNDYFGDQSAFSAFASPGTPYSTFATTTPAYSYFGQEPSSLAIEPAGPSFSPFRMLGQDEQGPTSFANPLYEAYNFTPAGQNYLQSLDSISGAPSFQEADRASLAAADAQRAFQVDQANRQMEEWLYQQQAKRTQMYGGLTGEHDYNAWTPEQIQAEYERQNIPNFSLTGPSRFTSGEAFLRSQGLPSRVPDIPNTGIGAIDRLGNAAEWAGNTAIDTMANPLSVMLAPLAFTGAGAAAARMTLPRLGIIAAREGAQNIAAAGAAQGATALAREAGVDNPWALGALGLGAGLLGGAAGYKAIPDPKLGVVEDIPGGGKYRYVPPENTLPGEFYSVIEPPTANPLRLNRAKDFVKGEDELPIRHGDTVVVKTPQGEVTATVRIRQGEDPSKFTLLDAEGKQLKDKGIRDIQQAEDGSAGKATNIRRAAPADVRFVEIADPAGRANVYRPAKGGVPMQLDDAVEELGFKQGSKLWQYAHDIDSVLAESYHKANQYGTAAMRRKEYLFREWLGDLLDQVRNEGQPLTAAQRQAAGGMIPGAWRLSAAERNWGQFRKMYGLAGGADEADDVLRNASTRYHNAQERLKNATDTTVKTAADAEIRKIAADTKELLQIRGRAKALENALANKPVVDEVVSDDAVSQFLDEIRKVTKTPDGAKNAANLEAEARAAGVIPAPLEDLVLSPSHPVPRAQWDDALSRLKSSEEGRAPGTAMALNEQGSQPWLAPSQLTPEELAAGRQLEVDRAARAEALADARKRADWETTRTLWRTTDEGATQATVFGNEVAPRPGLVEHYDPATNSWRRVEQPSPPLETVAGRGGGQPPSGGIPRASGTGPRDWNFGLKAVGKVLKLATALPSIYTTSSVGIGFDHARRLSFGGFGHPQAAISAIQKGNRALVSADAANAIDAAQRASPEFRKMDELGFGKHFPHPTEEGGGVEGYNLTWSDKNPLTRFFKRGNTVSENEMRLKSFGGMEKQAEWFVGRGNLPLSVETKLAEWAVASSGRATYQVLDQIPDRLKFIREVFFLRWQLSFVQRAQDVGWAISHISDTKALDAVGVSSKLGLNPAAAIILKDTAAYIVGMNATLTTIAAATNGRYHWNPQDKDWGKIEWDGKKYDTWGGSRSWAQGIMKLGAAAVQGDKEEFKDAAWEFAEKRITPGVGLAMDAIFKQDAFGNRIDWSSDDPWWRIASSLAFGLIGQEFMDGLYAGGLGEALSTLPEAVGIGATGMVGGQEAYDRLRERQKEDIAKEQFNGLSYDQLSEPQKLRVEIAYREKRNSTDQNDKNYLARLKFEADEKPIWQANREALIEKYQSDMAAGKPPESAGKALRQALAQADRTYYTKAQQNRIENPVDFGGEDSAYDKLQQEWFDGVQKFFRDYAQPDYDGYERFKADFISKAMVQAPTSDLVNRLLGTGKFSTAGLNPVEQQLEEDRKAIAESGMWDDKPVRPKVDMVLENPELEERLRRWGYEEKTLQAADAYQEARASMQAADKQPGGQFIATLKEIRSQLRSKLDGIYGAGDPAAVSDTPVLDRYYYAIDSATDATGLVDWKQVDAFMASLTPEEQAQIKNRTIANRARWSTDRVEEYYSTVEKLAELHYYDIGDMAWKAWAAKNDPSALKFFSSVKEFEDAVTKGLARKYGDPAGEPKQWQSALSVARTEVKNLSQRKGQWGDIAGDYRDDFRNWLGSSNPELFKSYLDFEMPAGADVKKSFYNWYYSTQRK